MFKMCYITYIVNLLDVHSNLIEKRYFNYTKPFNENPVQHSL